LAPIMLNMGKYESAIKENRKYLRTIN
jgi:hypothetical protein